jgi:hypothetical protein
VSYLTPKSTYDIILNISLDSFVDILMDSSGVRLDHEVGVIVVAFNLLHLPDDILMPHSKKIY